MFNIFNFFKKKKDIKEYPENKIISKLLEKDLAWDYSLKDGFMYEAKWYDEKNKDFYHVIKIDYCWSSSNMKKFQIMLKSYLKDEELKEEDERKPTRVEIIDSYSPLTAKLFDKVHDYLQNKRDTRLKKYIDEVADGL